MQVHHYWSTDITGKEITCRHSRVQDRREKTRRRRTRRIRKKMKRMKTRREEREWKRDREAG